METSLAVDPPGTQGNKKEKGEDGPLTTTCLSKVDNNDDQQLSTQTATVANSSESLISKTTMLLKKNARLKAQLASSQQKISDKEFEIAKMDHTFNMVNLDLINRIQNLMKADKPQNIAYSKEIDRILKYVQEQGKYDQELEMQRKLRLQCEQNFSKVMEQKRKKLTERMKPFDKAGTKMEPQEEPEVLLTQTDKPVEKMAPLTKQKGGKAKKVDKRAKKQNTS